MGDVEGYASLIEAIKETVPVPIEFENIESGAKGYFHIEDNRIAIQEGMSEVQTVKTMIHEAAHQALHSKEAMEHSGEKKSQNQKETEAESIAYVVCQHFGIDTSEYSFPYVATWSADKEVPELKASLDTIRSCSAKMIVSIEEKVRDKEIVETKEANKAGYDFEALEDFIKNNGDDIPFDTLVDKPTVTVEPVIDFNEAKNELEVAKAEEKKEEPTKEDAKAESKEEKNPQKKESIKDKIKKEKAKSEKTKAPKKTPKKDLAQAI